MGALSFEFEDFAQFEDREFRPRRVPAKSRRACPRCRRRAVAARAHAQGALAAVSSKLSAGAVESFDTFEHAELGTPTQGGIQALVDAWATAGLVDGGAFIDTGAVPSFAPGNAGKSIAKPIADWRITIPDAIPVRGSGLPYSRKALTPGARWHWIGPDPVFRRRGERWTPESLRAALLAGEAIALNLGQIVFLAGDLLPSFKALKDPGSREIAPVPMGTMAGYRDHDPYAWELLSQLSPTPHQEEAFYRNRELALLAALEQPKYAESLRRYEALRRALTSAKPPAWAASLKKEVNLLRRLRGDSVYRELHVLAQTLWLPNTITNVEIVGQAPWLSAKERGAFLARPWQKYNDQFFQEVLTNGRYLALAFKNEAHFHPGNWTAFAQALRASLQAVEAHIASGSSPHPIPADAIAELAYGLHFLTDAFSAGHMRVPRARLQESGSAVAKIMHDIDGRMGLTVSNGFGQVWRAFGDGMVHGAEGAVGKELSKLQAIARKAGPTANLNAARAAVSAALKQLHYHAQGQRNQAHAAHVRAALDASRVASRDRLAGDERAPEGSPGPLGSVDSWIRMKLEERVQYLQKHQPRPLAVGPYWDLMPVNHPPLVEPDGRIDGNRLGQAGFRWAKDWGKLNENRRIKVTLPSFPTREIDVLDATSIYQVTINWPGGAKWAPRETKLVELFNNLPEDKFD